MGVQNAMQYTAPFPRFKNRLALTLGVTYALLSEKIRQENAHDVMPVDVWQANPGYASLC